MLDLILIQDARSERFQRLIQLSPRFRLVAEVALDDLDGLDDALARSPAAAAVVSTESASGEVEASRLIRAGRRGLIEGPVSPARMLRLPPNEELQIAHGWVNLPGRLWLERLLTSLVPRRIRFDIAGIPNGEACELSEVIAHAVALVTKLSPDASSLRIDQRHEDDVSLRGQNEQGVEIDLALSARGHRLRLHAEGPGFHLSYALEGSLERLQLDRNGHTESRERKTPSAEERALAQIVNPALGDSLATARRGWELSARILEALPYRPGISRRALSMAAASERKSGLGLDALGLRGSLTPQAEERLVFSPPSLLSSLPLELFGVLAGIKPVAFLTLAPSSVDQVLAAASGLAIERRERLVQIDSSQDAWTDRRDQGRPFVELYISRDPAQAKRCAKLQAEGDPTANMAELGELLGYPGCCIRAFASQRDRSNNTANRYASFARTRAPGPWPFQLQNFWDTLTPFFPCRYDCPAGYDYAQRSLEALEAHELGTLARLEGALAHPMLYFTHGVSLTLREGSWAREGDTVKVYGYSGVGIRQGGGPFERELAAWLAAGDDLELGPASLTISRSGQPISRLERVGPRLGIIAPFGKAQPKG